MTLMGFVVFTTFSDCSLKTAIVAELFWLSSVQSVLS